MVMVIVMVIVVVFRKKYTSPRGENSEDITVQGLQGPRSTKVSMSRQSRGDIYHGAHGCALVSLCLVRAVICNKYFQ